MKTQLEDLNHKWRGLLETIRALQASVGDGLTDNEVTRLLRESALPIEAGFKFLSFSHWFVTLTVPRQELANWYPEKGWIVPEKEGIARAIAKKYELFFFEPPDLNSSALYDSPGPHHHLELNNREETVVVAHPQYLKIRLFKGPSGFVHALSARIPLLLSPELLQDLSFLYKSELNPATSEWAVPQKAVTALDRFGHVDEVAALVAFVAGPESSYITGANLTVDGGMNA